MSRRIHHTLDQLLILDAIDRTGTFARAAAELHRVPSAISYGVKQLEEGLGVEVFDRSRRRATLTPAGRSLLRHAREVLDQASQLESVASQIRDGWEAELHVVVDGVFPMALITEVLRDFGEARIPTRLRVDVEHQWGVPDRFESDNAHIMLLLDFEDDEGIYTARPLPDLPMVLAVASTHALAGQEALTRDDLSAHLELVVKDSAPRFAATPRRAFLGSPHVIHLSDFHSKRIGLLGGAGFGWIPRHLVAADLAQGDLVPVGLQSGHAWTYHPHLVTRRHEQPGRAATRFLDALSAVSSDFSM